jgi:hypothetical protein
MTTYFHASADELAAHGTAPLAAVADSHVFQRSFCDQSVELYGAGGPLLTTAVQVAFFRFQAHDRAGQNRRSISPRGAILPTPKSP